MTTTRRARAEAFAALLPDLSPRVWVRGERIRVYLRYPKPYNGGAGGGDLGHVDFSGDKPRIEYSAPADLNAKIKAVLTNL